MKLEFPPKYSDWIEKQIQKLGYQLSQSKKLAQQIELLSDYYNKNEIKQTPWLNEATQLAYVCYFFPLNYLRSLAVIEKNKSLNFFNNFEYQFEVGSGLGSTNLAMLDAGLSFKKNIFLESSNIAKNQHQSLIEQFYPKQDSSWSHQFKSNWFKSYNLKAKTLFTASYSINEVLGSHMDLNELGRELDYFDGHLIVEPSTQKHSRSLLKLRSELLSTYKVWAPCTHQGPCPLLTHSVKDWCHDRVFIKMPDWYYDIESKLKIKNNTLTYSYLMIHKNQPPSFVNSLARVIGDTQKEKGKTIQMICRGESREFLSWLKKNKNSQWIERGQLIDIPKDAVQKANEIRVESPVMDLNGKPIAD